MLGPPERTPPTGSSTVPKLQLPGRPTTSGPSSARAVSQQSDLSKINHFLNERFPNPTTEDLDSIIDECLKNSEINGISENLQTQGIKNFCIQKGMFREYNTSVYKLIAEKHNAAIPASVFSARGTPQESTNSTLVRDTLLDAFKEKKPTPAEAIEFCNSNSDLKDFSDKEKNKGIADFSISFDKKSGSKPSPNLYLDLVRTSMNVKRNHLKTIAKIKRQSNQFLSKPEFDHPYFKGKVRSLIKKELDQIIPDGLKKLGKIQHIAPELMAAIFKEMGPLDQITLPDGTTQNGQTLILDTKWYENKLLSPETILTILQALVNLEIIHLIPSQLDSLKKSISDIETKQKQALDTQQLFNAKLQEQLPSMDFQIWNNCMIYDPEHKAFHLKPTLFESFSKTPTVITACINAIKAINIERATKSESPITSIQLSGHKYKNNHLNEEETWLQDLQHNCTTAFNGVSVESNETQPILEHRTGTNDDLDDLNMWSAKGLNYACIKIPVDKTADVSYPNGCHGQKGVLFYGIINGKPHIVKVVTLRGDPGKERLAIQPPSGEGDPKDEGDQLLTALRESSEEFIGKSIDDIRELRSGLKPPPKTTGKTFDYHTFTEGDPQLSARSHPTTYLLPLGLLGTEEPITSKRSDDIEAPAVAYIPISLEQQFQNNKITAQEYISTILSTCVIKESALNPEAHKDSPKYDRATRVSSKFENLKKCICTADKGADIKIFFDEQRARAQKPLLKEALSLMSL